MSNTHQFDTTAPHPLRHLYWAKDPENPLRYTFGLVIIGQNMTIKDFQCGLYWLEDSFDSEREAKETLAQLDIDLQLQDGHFKWKELGAAGEYKKVQPVSAYFLQDAAKHRFAGVTGYEWSLDDINTTIEYLKNKGKGARRYRSYNPPSITIERNNKQGYTETVNFLGSRSQVPKGWHVSRQQR